MQTASLLPESSCAMIDPFADALVSDSDGGADDTKPAAAHSPVATVQGAMQGARTVPSAAAPPRKRASAASKATVYTKRAKVDPLVMLNTYPLQEVSGSKIECIFVPWRKQETQSIVLWPQYTAVWKGADFKSRTWLKVSARSQWLEHLVTTVTKNKHSRNVMRRAVLAARAEFAACLLRARAAKCATLGKSVSQVFAEEMKADAEDSQHSTTLEEIEDENDDISLDGSDDSQHKPPPNDAAMAVQISGKSVMCINVMRPFCLAVDADTVEFIKEVMVPLIQKVARSPAKDSPATDTHQATPANTSAPNGSQPNFSFSFELNHVCNNIPNKVQWDPKSQMWRVFAQKVKKG